MIDNDAIYFGLGVLLTFITTYIGIWYSNKNKVKTELSLFDQNWMSLINTFEDNFKILKLENYVLPNNKNLYYYQGVIINTGNTDVDNSKIYKPLEIILDNDCKIIEVRNDNGISEVIGLSINYEEQRIVFNWKLLKPLENFPFEIIIESSKNLNARLFHKNITLEHRISELGKIKRVDAWNIQNTKKKETTSSKIIIYIGILFFIIISSFSSYLGIKSFFKPEIDVDYIAYSKFDKMPVTFKYIQKDSIQITHNNIVEKISIKDFDKYIYTVSKINTKNNQYVLAILGTFFTLFFIIGIVFTIKDDIYQYKVSKIIQILK